MSETMTTIRETEAMRAVPSGAGYVPNYVKMKETMAARGTVPRKGNRGRPKGSKNKQRCEGFRALPVAAEDSKVFHALAALWGVPCYQAIHRIAAAVRAANPGIFGAEPAVPSLAAEDVEAAAQAEAGGADVADAEEEA